MEKSQKVGVEPLNFHLHHSFCDSLEVGEKT
jgi:hypothetical protein